MTREKPGAYALRWAAVILAVVILLFPIYWMLISSVTPGGDLMTPDPKIFPARFSMEHYRNVLADSPFPIFLFNSFKVATVVTLLAIPLAFSGGYALSRYRFRGRNSMGMVLLMTQMLPAILLAVPLYVIISGLGLVNTHWALMICYTTFAIPFSTWMLKGFFDGLPKELEESAQIDGCGRYSMLFRIVFPLSTPGLVATAVLAFLLAWNEYLFAVLFINSEELKTFPVGITMFTSRWRVDYGALMAASVMVSAPVSVLFLGLQKWLVSGLTAGATKG